MSDEQKPHTLTGDFRMHEGFHSRYLESEHDVIVYLPPGYDEDADRRYPVLYLHDGQNVFDEATSFGDEWHVDETAELMIREGHIAPLIVVGIYNTGAYRIDEYTPTRDSAKGAGGHADDYGRMLVEELKPFIDSEYNTLADARNTGIGGSSLGGLLTMHLALKYSGISGTRGAVAQCVVGRPRDCATGARAERGAAAAHLARRGHGGGRRRSRRRAALRDALVAKGWTVGEALHYQEIEGAGHTESAWADVGARDAAISLSGQSIMHREHRRWYSPSLGKDMDLLVFGHAGARVLVFPTSMGRFFEWEDRGMIGALGEHLERGWLQLYCVDSVDAESWYAKWKHPADRARRHEAYDAYCATRCCRCRRTGTPIRS